MNGALVTSILCSVNGTIATSILCAADDFDPLYRICRAKKICFDHLRGPIAWNLWKILNDCKQWGLNRGQFDFSAFFLILYHVVSLFSLLKTENGFDGKWIDLFLNSVLFLLTKQRKRNQFLFPTLISLYQTPP